MKPVAIFRHLATEGPGYFATYLERHDVPWELVSIDAGDAVPSDPRTYSGLCFMGGPMSVNDDLPWIRDELELIRRAVDADVPVIGHCLGGQLMAKALGGVVTRNRVKAIEAVRSWKFEPAKKDGQPVAVQVNVEVNFRLY
ncbi:MAG TPA: energy transducer TonB [Burkholderiales bacterium]|nr:energy transducer TonB [Burkholderiales bacterium]